MTSSTSQALACLFWQTVMKTSKSIGYTFHLKVKNMLRSFCLYTRVFTIGCFWSTFKEINIVWRKIVYIITLIQLHAYHSNSRPTKRHLKYITISIGNIYLFSGHYFSQRLPNQKTFLLQVIKYFKESNLSKFHAGNFTVWLPHQRRC